MTEATLTIHGPDRSDAINLTRYLHSDRSVADIEMEQWIYQGVWSREVNGIDMSTPIRISLLQRSDDTTHINGFLRLEDYSITHQLRARIARN